MYMSRVVVSAQKEGRRKNEELVRRMEKKRFREGGAYEAKSTL